MIKNIVHKLLHKNFLKGIFVLFIGFCVFGTVLGNYEEFLDNLRWTGIPVDEILESDQVSRYELTRLLNGVNCKDCVNTPSWMIDKYTNPWRNNFIELPGKDFDEISYRGGIYNGQIYYYCVAYVGDNIWMRGYPEGVSPICDGMFCGNRNTTIGEFLQVVLNVADEYVYQSYNTDWSKIKVWMNGLVNNSYPKTWLNDEDEEFINQYGAQNLSGIIPNEKAFQAYLKYCMFNTKQCEMQSFGNIVEGYRPIAELNILYDSNIVEYEKFEDGEIHELASGEYVLKTLYKLFKIIDCDFDQNYDCDPVDNLHDKCPNHYNPSQKDTDQDGVGDVCDIDIDGDGILNPIGIVDELGRIVISKLDQNMDNCLFVPNPKQVDSDSNNVGDVCEDNKNYLGMYIKTNGINDTAPVTVNFEAVTDGEVIGDIIRDFGDGSEKRGFNVSHTFIDYGLYNVTANASGINNQANASIKILVGKNMSTNYGLQIIPNKIKGDLPLEIKFDIDSKGIYDYFERDFGNGVIERKPNEVDITKFFREQKSQMVIVKGIKDNKIVAAANTIISAGENEIASNIYSNNLSLVKGQNIEINTITNGFDKDDIEIVEWNWGDGTSEINKNLKLSHKYDSSGPYMIIQKIKLNNGKELQNFLTIYVRDIFVESSYSIETSLKSTVLNHSKKAEFKINKVGYIPEILLVKNKFDKDITVINNDNFEKRPKYFDFKYIKKGIYTPKTSVFVNECIELGTIETVAIKDDDICMEAILNNNLDQYKCDYDKDGIPDICDDDIDGDGITNLLGLINYEREDCNINSDNINWDILGQHNGVCGLDNCPPFANKDQIDLNNNGWGDMCDKLYYNDENIDSNNDYLDSDSDGIYDYLDSCPLIPENYNGIEDFDGCPEIGLNINCDIGSIDVNNDYAQIISAECLSCPCSFSDFSNDLMLDDKIKAKLRDFGMSVLYNDTIAEPIRKFLE